MDPINPPAIVKSASEADSLVAELARDKADLTASERQTVQMRVAFGGKLTRLQAMLPEGEWLKRLKVLGVSQPTAWRRMRDYRNREELFTVNSPEDQLARTAERSPEEKVDATRGGEVTFDLGDQPGDKKGRKKGAGKPDTPAPPEPAGAQPGLDLDPVATLAAERMERERAKVAKAHELMAEFNALVKDILGGPAKTELCRLARLHGVPVDEDPVPAGHTYARRWPIAETVFRITEKLDKQGFEA